MKLWLTLIFPVALSACASRSVPFNTDFSSPPPLDEWKAQLALFSSLLPRLPAADLSSFTRLVADDVQVYRDNKIIYRTRKDWVEEFQSYKQKSPRDPQGFSVSRDQYSLLSDGGISVREFTYPIAPEGASVVYHPSYPLRYVTYYLYRGKLVRVIYGPAMTSYGGLCQEVEKAKKSSAVTISSACK
jgi:hypothetical protein